MTELRIKVTNAAGQTHEVVMTQSSHDLTIDQMKEMFAGALRAVGFQEREVVASLYGEAQ